jgi:HEAT repeat protein
MKLLRARFGIRALMALVAVCALLAWAVRVSRDSRPAYLYADWLNDGDDPRRIQAALELGGQETESAVTISALVRALLTDGAALVRKQSALSLARVVSKLDDGPTTEAAADALIEALRDKAPAVRTAAADGLGRIGPEPKAVVSALVQAAGDEDEWVRGAAVAALGLIQKKAGVDRMEVRPTIVAALNDASFHVREMGIYAFWATAEKSPDLSITLLQDGDVRTRRSAVNALARSSQLAREVIPQLTTALTDEDASVCVGAARALGNIWPPPRTALPALVRTLNHQDSAVRAAATAALSAIDDRDAVPDPLGQGRIE